MCPVPAKPVKPIISLPSADKLKRDMTRVAVLLRKQLQIEHAPHISPQAQLVKLADKISNVRDTLASPPADWSPERKQAYFDWAAAVVAGLRGVHPGLDGVFDGLYARRLALPRQAKRPDSSRA